MATQHKVGCVDKSDRPAAHERIRSIGGIREDGSRWKLSQEVAIVGIEEGRWQFHVTVGKETVRVVVATSSQGHRYLKTTADGEQPDNLLSLPECP